ncbi:hypothetical protein PaeCFBP13512_05185 [Paenibacillus sp. CFBP13512]|uniref:hypothetical protein n=1 Tax=Paenibacillus sp. CFBP13512 TaxID=2184007 RepID=UPI0010C14EF5|nr:hypothetical protein [Paenibacillus sp. CFBP13512]TKJ92749.1 hypothetical protein PaeCFBP13512_05185 [Paenibacillus sp. CFBP13512]
MSGPSLRQLHAHHSIHEGGLSGAITKTEELEEFMQAGEHVVAKYAAHHLIDYWETRIISHADAEEEIGGFYDEKLTQQQELATAIIQLKRDHDLMKMILKNIKDTLATEELNDALLQQFQALIVLNNLHSREEERLLFA